MMGCSSTRASSTSAAVETPPTGILSIHRALRAVGHALGPSAPALVMFVRFDVGFTSTPTAFLSLIILVLPARAGGFIQAAIAPVTSRLVSR
jgi:hypothetical protein